MNQRYFYIAISILGILLLFNSCCKSERCKCQKEWGEDVKECKPVHYGPFSLGGAKDYLYFKPGSLWVYKSSITGELDSIYTTVCDTSITEAKGHDKPWLSITYTTISIYQISRTFGTVYNYFRLKPNLDVFDGLYRQYQWRNSNFSNFSAFVYPFPSGKVSNFFDYYPSLTIGDSTYYEVAAFYGDQYDHSVQIPNQLGYGVTKVGLSKYFWAKNHGLIMTESTFERTDNHQIFTHKWELLKCNFLQ